MLDNKEQFQFFLQSELNKPQQDAVALDKGALLVIAGAGSGKTRVITSRIANLILNKEVRPSSIVALTFTNKAAGEMKERVAKFVGINSELPFVGTFHSYCLLQLKTNAARLNLPPFSILDSDDQESLIKRILKKNSVIKFGTPSQISSQISKLKNQGAANFLGDAIVHPILKEIYNEYEAEKTNAHCFDFDDLLLQMLQLLKNNLDFKVRFQRNIKHILVDEYQDTNHVQHQLLRAMALNEEHQMVLDSLCAVGDEDQSIYSWRGATVANMLKFEQDFAPVQKIKIEQNYRSVQPILQAANQVISNNLLRNPKNLWSDKNATNRILVTNCRNGDQEAEAIANFIKSLPGNKKLNDVAILYRTHFQSRTIEEAFIYHAIPYKIVGGIRFYERKEIKDLIAYLRLIANPFDKISLLRIINCPTRGFGQKFEELIIDEWRKNPLLDFKQLLTWFCESSQIDMSENKKISVKSFLNIFDELERTDIPSDALEKIIARTEYLTYLKDEYDVKEAETKLGNVKELLQSSINFELSFKTSKAHLNPLDPFYLEITEPTLEAFLQEISLMQEKLDSENANDQVQMMTLHAAKGLEFDYVVICGLEENLLPSARSLNTNDALEEERRLFYVGMTRAREYLLLLNASARNTYGQFTDQISSRFLDEIPKKLIDVLDLESIYNPLQIKDIFQNWINNKLQLKPIPSPSKSNYARPATNNHSNSLNPKDTAAVEGIWKKNQTVKHAKFGTGIITGIEKATDNEYYLTIIFKAGQKKILSSFLSK